MHGKEDNMLEQLREVAGLGGPAAALANDILVIADQYSNGELSQEEFQFMMEQIAQVRASAELATDEQACRFIVQAATALSKVVL